MRPIPLAQFRAEVLRLYAPSSSLRKSVSTYQKMEQLFDELEQLEVVSTADLTTETARKWVDRIAAESGPNTVRGRIGYFRALCNLALEDHYLEKMPRLRHLSPASARMTKNPVLRYAQVRQLLEYQQSQARSFRTRRLLAATATAALTGLRRDELLHLRLEDFDWSWPVLRVVYRPGCNIKPSAERSVPISGELRAFLREWLPWTVGSPWMFPNASKSGPWCGGNQTDRPLGQLQASAIAAGVGHVTWHGLRHSFATIALRRWKRPIEWVSKVLGHRSLTTTMRYLHLDDPEFLLDGADELGFKLVS